MLNMGQCLFIISFTFSSTELFVDKNGIVPLGLGLECFKSNISIGGQLSQLVFLQLIHCSPFQQIFLIGLANVSCIPED